MLQVNLYLPNNNLLDVFYINKKDLESFYQLIDKYPLHIVKNTTEYYFTIDKDKHFSVVISNNKEKSNNKDSLLYETLLNDKCYIETCNKEEDNAEYIEKINQILSILNLSKDNHAVK